MKKRAGRKKLNKIRVNITLDKNLYDELSASKVQISTIDDLIIKNRIFTEGICLYEKTKFKFSRIKRDVKFEYLDYKPKFKKRLEINKRELLNMF